MVIIQLLAFVPAAAAAHAAPNAGRSRIGRAPPIAHTALRVRQGHRYAASDSAARAALKTVPAAARAAWR